MRLRPNNMALSFALVCLIVIAPLGAVWAGGTIEAQPDGGDEDAEQAGASFTHGSSDLDMMNDDHDYIAETHDSAAIRFKGIAIPQGATIDSAYITFTSRYDNNDTDDPTSLIIYGQKAQNPWDFDDSSVADDDIASRDKTTVSVAWDNVESWTAGNEYNTPDLSAVVQEIVNYNGAGTDADPFWNAGGSMVFIIEGNPGGERVAWSYDGDGDAPVLHIEWSGNVDAKNVADGDDDAEEEPDGDVYLPSGDLDLNCDGYETIGLRFQNMQVPKGVVITRAFIQFEADVDESGTASTVIFGEDTDNAAIFTSTDNDVSSRTKTSASITWDNIPDWTEGGRYVTPDLSSIVQEIVGRSGWNPGQAMAFVLTNGSGARRAVSYDGYDSNTQTPPLLHVEWSSDPVPYISVDQTNIGASSFVGSNPASQTLTITNSGSADLTYAASESATWLTLSPTGSRTVTSGSTDTLTLNFFTSALATGTYSTTISITDANAPNSPYEVTVSVTIIELPPGASCGHVPVYTENLVSPAILILMDTSGSMGYTMPVTDPDDDPTTPDLSAIVQEIIGIEDWAQGDPMAFIFTGSGVRAAVSYDQNSGSAPLLHIEYTDGGVPDNTFDVRVSSSSDDAEEGSSATYLPSTDLEINQDGYIAMGLRFQNVDIPKTATITDAYIQFVPNQADTSAATWTIDGEASGDSATFDTDNDEITGRTRTTASVSWTLGDWNTATWQKRITIAKEAMSDLVKDRGVSWGFGTWTGSYSSSYDYTKVHVGCKLHTDDHQTDLQNAISSASEGGNTPLTPQLLAAEKYFLGNKKDDDGAGDYFDTTIDCQPLFLMTVTDGEGNTGTSGDNWKTQTTSLLNNGVTPVAVGFGIDQASAYQLYDIAEISNNLGGASDADYIYALHNEASGTGVPFLANNKQELVEALAGITESVKAAVFNGSAPAPTTSADLGDTVLVAHFDATDWSGDLEAVVQASDGDWDAVSWTASDVLPGTRKVFTVDPSDHASVISYADGTLTGDNYAIWDSGTTCGSSDKEIGDIINSTPIVVGTPSYYYNFDNYTTWKNSTDRDSMVYIGANDGALHAFKLADGSEKWAFVPEAVHDKLEMATDATYDMCSDDYCHQYFVDGSPQAADIFDGTDWKTIIVTGLGEGGDAYFALDVTSGEPFDHSTDPAEFLWEYADSELGETWTAASIARVRDGSDEEWGVFFGSGYSTTDQTNKQAYLYGIVADSAAEMWNDGSSDTDRILISPSGATGTLEFYSKVADFTAGEVVTGSSSGAYGTITTVNSDSLTLQDIFGTFIEDETISDPSGGAALVYAPLEGAKLDDALASPLVVDLDADDISDQIYVGNLYGIMYRVRNIGKGETPTVSKLLNFSPVKTSNDDTPIRAQAAFAYQAAADNIWVYFGTGRYETQADKTTMTQQYFFGLKDSLTSTDEYTYKVGTGLQLSGSDLVTLDAEYVTDDTTGTEVRIITGDNPSGDSWAVRLDNSSSGIGGSERVIVKPLVAGGIVFFTTFIPDQNICAGNGDTWVYALNYATGEAPSDPVFDLNEDGVVDDQDKAVDSEGNVYNVAAVSVGAGQGSNPVLYKKTLFITTTGEGLEGLQVDVGDINVQLGAWKEKF